MLNSVLSLGKNGIHNWFILRITAVIIVLYSLYISGFILTAKNINYNTWHYFFSLMSTKIFSIITFISILIHVWIGIYQVLTDYIKYLTARLIIQITIFIFLLTWLIYVIITVWNI